jgi:two-component system response regulator
VHRFRRAKVLLAEDNPDDVEIARRALKRNKQPIDLIVTRDGQEAIDVLKRQAEGRRYCDLDLILLDINLPKFTGLEVLGGLRADLRFRGVPVVMLSASANEDDVRRSYELGANSYVQKPVVFDEFVETLGVITRYWFEVARVPQASA